MSFIASPPPSRHGHPPSAHTSPSSASPRDLFPLLHSLHQDPAFSSALQGSSPSPSRETRKTKRMSRSSSAGGGLLKELLSPSRAGASAKGVNRRDSLTPAARYAAQTRSRSQLSATTSISAQVSLLHLERERDDGWSGGGSLIPQAGMRREDENLGGLWERLEKPGDSARTSSRQNSNTRLDALRTPQYSHRPSVTSPNLPSPLSLPPGAQYTSSPPSFYPQFLPNSQLQPPTSVRLRKPSPPPSSAELTQPPPHRAPSLSLRGVHPFAQALGSFKRLVNTSSTPAGPARATEGAQHSSAPTLLPRRTRTRGSSLSTFASLTLSPSSPTSATSQQPHSATSTPTSPLPRLQARDDVASIRSLDTDSIWDSRKQLLEVLREGPPSLGGAGTARRGVDGKKATSRVRNEESDNEGDRERWHMVKARSADDLRHPLLVGDAGKGSPRMRSTWALDRHEHGRSESGYWSYGSRWDGLKKRESGGGDGERREERKGWRGWRARRS